MKDAKGQGGWYGWEMEMKGNPQFSSKQVSEVVFPPEDVKSHPTVATYFIHAKKTRVTRIFLELWLDKFKLSLFYFASGISLG